MKEKMGQHNIVQLSSNHIPRGLVPLEEIFDHNDVPTRNATHQVIMKFLYENIFIRFGFPKRLVTDNAPGFKAGALVKMCETMGIQLVHYTSYYPQGNGLAKSSNKSLVRIIRKLLEKNQKS